jgi:hypothetical protein
MTPKAGVEMVQGIVRATLNIRRCAIGGPLLLKTRYGLCHRFRILLIRDLSPFEIDDSIFNEAARNLTNDGHLLVDWYYSNGSLPDDNFVLVTFDLYETLNMRGRRISFRLDLCKKNMKIIA